MQRRRLTARSIQGTLAVAGAVLAGAAPASAVGADPSPTTSLLPSSAIFQSPTCTASGAHTAFVTMMNGATAAQTFSFTTNSGDVVTPAGVRLAPGETRGATITIPARATAVYVTAGTSSVGSLPLTACSRSSNSSAPSSISTTPKPTSSATRSSTAVPTTAPTSTSASSSTRPSASSSAPSTAATTPTAAPTTQAPTSRAPQTSASSSSRSASSSASSQSGAGAASVPPIAPAPTSLAPATDADPSSTNPLYVAAGVAVGIIGLALAVVAIRREFTR